MIDRETLKECHVCLIGYLLKNIEDIDKLSITKDYLKDFSIQGKKYNFKYIFALFKKIVALSNLIQRIYHNDIRNMLP